MDVVFFVVELLHSQLWIVTSYFVDFVLEVGSKTFVNYLSSVFGTQDDMVVATVDRVGIMNVFHVSILPRRGGGGVGRLHPASLRSGIFKRC